MLQGHCTPSPGGRRLCTGPVPETLAGQIGDGPEKRFSRTSSASALPGEQTRTQPSETLSYFRQDHHAVNVCRIGGNSHLHRKPCRGHEAKILVPYSKTKTHKNSFFPTAIRLWDIPPPPPPPPPKKRLTVRLSPSPVFLYYP